MSNPKKHHFVPKSYLQGFTEEESGFLHLFSKRSNQWRRQKPKQVMVRNQYYYQESAPDGVDKNILEKMLGAEMEPKGLAAIKKLIEDPEKITAEDTANIIEYLQFQRIRVPRQSDMAKSLTKTALTLHLMRTLKGREALKLGKIDIKDSFRFEFMRIVHGSLSPYISRMIWELVKAPDSTSFVTSDSPVTFFNVDFLPPTEPGIALYGTTVLFPINKRYLLLMKHPEYEQGSKGTSEMLPRELDVEDGVVEVRRGTVWEPNMVDRQNWMMFQQCQDVIVGERKEILDKAIGKTLEVIEY